MGKTKIGRRLIAALAAATAAAGVALVSTPTDSESKDWARTDARLHELLSKDASPAQIKRQTGLVLVSDDRRSDVQLATAAGDISLSRPSIWYSTRYHYYVATSKFAWYGTRWKKDVPAYLPMPYSSRKLGGLDGFGLRVDRRINNYGGSVRISPSKPTNGGTFYYKSYTTRNYWANNSYGASFKFLEKARGWYNSDGEMTHQFSAQKGTITFKFKKLSKGCHQVYTTVGHTWEDSSINGFSVSSSGFGISWTNNTYHWKRASSAGKLHCS